MENLNNITANNQFQGAPHQTASIEMRQISFGI